MAKSDSNRLLLSVSVAAMARGFLAVTTGAASAQSAPTADSAAASPSLAAAADRSTVAGGAGDEVIVRAHLRNETVSRPQGGFGEGRPGGKTEVDGA